MTNEVIYPQRWRHLDILNPKLNEIDLERRVRRGRPEYQATKDSYKLAEATLALVDDYAEFCTLNPDTVNPYLTFITTARKRARWSDFRYIGGTSGHRVDAMSLMEIKLKRGECYFLEEGQLPEKETVPVWVSKSTTGISVKTDDYPRNTKHEIKGRIVEKRFLSYDRILEFETDEQTTISEVDNPKGFVLTKIHSPLYTPTIIPPATQARRTYESIVFCLNSSGFLTSSTPESVIPDLEKQLALLEGVEAPKIKSDIHRLLGFGYQRKCDREKAMEHYLKALQQNPHICRNAVGKALFDIGYHTKAVEVFGETIRNESVGEGLGALFPYLQAQVQRLRT